LFELYPKMAGNIFTEIKKKQWICWLPL
jgi:Fe-S cluster biosynthesis and repair protein YggX